MKIVFCTTCKDRGVHLALTLPKNFAGNPRSTFVVLDYGTRPDEFPNLRELGDERVKVYHYDTIGPFRMAHAKNMAHRLGMLEGADVLVNLDADNYTGEGFEDSIEERFRLSTVLKDKFIEVGWGSPYSNIFLWSGFVKGLGRKFRGVGGRIAVTPSAFVKAGGYDEKYDTWAPDDKDFNARLVHLGYQPVVIDRQFLESIPHGDGMRFKEYPHVREAAQGEDAELAPLRTAVANFGKIGCGELIRPDGSTVKLAPLPTRIFGIGLHKTATNSLSKALSILGYESAHWESGGWARDVWNEMNSPAFISPTLERFYAACDLPISILFRQLDRSYPGSKFILTMRPEAEWLKSVEAHFSWKNPFRWEWDVYPFSNKIHQIVYGRKTFDAETFLARYRRHNAEVIEYFRDRPGDLLLMPYPRWYDLCKFLGKPIPSVDYPREFVTNAA